MPRIDSPVRNSISLNKAESCELPGTSQPFHRMFLLCAFTQLLCDLAREPNAVQSNERAPIPLEDRNHLRVSKREASPVAGGEWPSRAGPRLREPELFHPCSQSKAGDIEQLRGLGLVPAGSLDRLRYQSPLHFFQGDAALRQANGVLCQEAHRAQDQMSGRNEFTLFEDYSALDDIPQFSDVSWPIIGRQLLLRGKGEAV